MSEIGTHEVDVAICKEVLRIMIPDYLQATS